MAPAGTWTWMVLPSKSLGSMSNASALDHTYETAAWALSRMTSPSIPVSTRRSSLLGIIVTSTNRTSPPVGVQARPVATPGRAVRSTTSSKNRGTAQIIGEAVGGDAERPGLALREAAGDLAGHGGDLAFEVPHARLAGIAAHDQSNGVRLEDQLVRLEAVRAELLGHQVLRRDADLLLVRVAGERQDFHPVAQRARDGVERVAGGDEEDLREVERHAEIG